MPSFQKEHQKARSEANSSGGFNSGDSNNTPEATVTAGQKNEVARNAGLDTLNNKLQSVVPSEQIQIPQPAVDQNVSESNASQTSIAPEPSVPNKVTSAPEEPRPPSQSSTESRRKDDR